MDKRITFSDTDDQEVKEEYEKSFPDDWIEPEMLRRCATKYKTVSGELYEEQ